MKKIYLILSARETIKYFFYENKNMITDSIKKGVAAAMLCDFAVYLTNVEASYKKEAPYMCFPRLATWH